jgi:hypothetical protein
MKIREVLIRETATAGATSAGNIASVANPQVAIGKDRTNRSYTGTPGVSGTRAPKVPKIMQPKNSRRHSQRCSRTVRSESVRWTRGGEKMKKKFILNTVKSLKNKTITNPQEDVIAKEKAEWEQKNKK